MKSWYAIKNRAADVIDISLHDEIGLWGVSASDFMRELDAHSGVKAINLSIHSPGGSLLDGLAMYNKLKSHKATVYGRVEGIAASAASFVLMASDHISMPENAFIMIHNAFGGGIGEADDLREIADTLEKMQNSVARIYEQRTGLDIDEIKSMMAKETWMNADDALRYGFIDTITDKIDVAAKAAAFERYFRSLPVQNEFKPEAIGNERDYERFLRESGLPKGLATALVSRAKAIFKGDPEEPDAELAMLLDRLDKFKI